MFTKDHVGSKAASINQIVKSYRRTINIVYVTAKNTSRTNRNQQIVETLNFWKTMHQITTSRMTFTPEQQYHS